MRPTALEYIDRLTKNFYELHGDRLYGDDKSIIGGIAMFGKQPVTVVGLQKGMDTKDKYTEILECHNRRGIENHCV